jgi:hypothetical protein
LNNLKKQSALELVGMSDKELSSFDSSVDHYLMSSSVDKCKLEIKILLKRLEKFAQDNHLSLTTETVLKFIDKT